MNLPSKINVGSISDNSNISKSNSKASSASFASELESAIKETQTSTTSTLEDIFQKAAKTYGVDVNLLKAVAKTESGFDTQAVSSCGAQGIMQLMPETSKELGVTDPFDAEQNIMGGAKCLKQKLDEFGDTKLALAAYNAGSGAVKKYGGIPPYKETQNYVKKVMSYANESYDLSDRVVETSADSTVKTENELSLKERAQAQQTSSNNNVSIASLISTLSAYSQMSALFSNNNSGSNSGAMSYLTSSLMSNALNSALQNVANGNGSSISRQDYNSLMQLLSIQMQQSVVSSFGDTGSSFSANNYLNTYNTDYMSSMLSYINTISNLSSLENSSTDGKNNNSVDIQNVVEAAKNNAAAVSNAYTTSEYVNLMSSFL
ncbi:MAG: lytic transglycosylase domain-containing protein [Clostridiales bacterium]|nr:lytic transglycosylase domain-containing protein [Clostridiales bacterium]